MSACTRLLAAALLVLCACDGGKPAATEPTPCPSKSALNQSSPFLKRFPLATWGTVTALETKGKYVSAEAVAQTTVIELHPQIAREVIDRRYTIIGADNEGFESEIYFARNGKFYGAFRLREGPCKGDVTVRLLYLHHPKAGTEIPSFKTSPTPTPQG